MAEGQSAEDDFNDKPPEFSEASATPYRFPYHGESNGSAPREAIVQRQLIDQCGVIFWVVTLIASFMFGFVAVLIRWRSAFLAQVGISDLPTPQMHLALGMFGES